MIRDAVVILETFVAANGLPLVFNLKQDSGVAFNLTGYSVKLTATFNGATKINAVTVSITDMANGVCQYQPTAGEISDAGDYQAKLEIFLSTAMRRAEPFILRVLP